MENLIQIQQSADSIHTLNELYNDGKVYIMDNHMAAAWCWGQKLDISSKYNLFHIDKHYDLLNGSTNTNITQLNSQGFNLQKSSIENYVDIRDNQNNKIFRYDNYLTIFRGLYPGIFNQIKFATHKDGTIPSDWNLYEAEIFDLPGNLKYWIEEAPGKWIINIDIDYFFDKDDNDVYFQFLTDDYVNYVAQQLFKVINKIQIITIALSPTFCGGLANSKKLAEIFCSNLGVKPI